MCRGAKEINHPIRISVFILADSLLIIRKGFVIRCGNPPSLKLRRMKKNNPGLEPGLINNSKIT
jgi:hypothetical protein